MCWQVEGRGLGGKMLIPLPGVVPVWCSVASVTPIVVGPACWNLVPSISQSLSVKGVCFEPCYTYNRVFSQRLRSPQNHRPHAA